MTLNQYNTMVNNMVESEQYTWQGIDFKEEKQKQIGPNADFCVSKAKH